MSYNEIISIGCHFLWEIMFNNSKKYSIPLKKKKKNHQFPLKPEVSLF